ncbi:MAG TPA: hypothetical protein VFM35_06955 [Candidatus Binatia bacterium]|nr:hypothetical protein [Candidatus Binatia bacterium]
MPSEQMRRNALTLGVIFALTTNACVSQQPPTVAPVDIQHTAEAAAFTMVAQTEEALPTATRLPPATTTAPTARPTLTLLASPTSNVLPTATSTAISPSSGSTQDNCDKSLTAWQGPTAKLSIANETKPQGSIVLSLWVMTELGECGFLADLSAGPVGQYSAAAFVDGPKDFRVFGGFRITQGSWKIVVKNESIVAQGGCFPNC